MPTGTRAAVTQIDRLVAQCEADIAALRRVRTMLNGTGPGEQSSVATVLDHAMSLDAERRMARRGLRQRAKASKALVARGGGGTTEKPTLRQQRQRSADVLAQFDETEPRPSHGFRGMGSLVRRGYLRAKGDGYLRTSKPYVV
jgi:hypothetical protein